MILETRNLTKSYDGVLALDRVSLGVGEGDFISVMGPSGSGKTTLLNLIGALDRPSEGEVIIRGRSLEDVEDLDAFRNQEVGFVFQFQNLIPTMTAEENVEVPMYERKVPKKEWKERARRLLASVGLEERLHHRPSQLSGGERQRVAIARALANDPAIVLADEPTGELDSATGLEIVGMMRRINREGLKTFIIVTHDPEVAKRADRILFLRDGRVEREEVVRSEWVEDLMGLRNSSLGRMIVRGEAVRDEYLEEIGVFEDGSLGTFGSMLRELFSKLDSVG